MIHMVVMNVFHSLDKYFKDVDMIIHAGDVLYHGPRNPMLGDYNPAKITEKLNNCKMPVIICRGNCDSGCRYIGIGCANSSSIYLCSSRRLKNRYNSWPLCRNDEEKDKMAKALKADLFISGHVHIIIC